MTTAILELMNILTKTRVLFFICIIITQLESVGQNCHENFDPKTEIGGLIIAGGTISSNENYTLVIQKEYYFQNKLVPPKFHFYLSSNFKLSDTIPINTGKIKFQLQDSSIITYDSIVFHNVQKPYGRTLGFEMYPTENQMRVFVNNPVVSITVFDNLKTTFKIKQQRKQQKIVYCLLQ
jgi:hypothetical protein